MKRFATMLLGIALSIGAVAATAPVTCIAPDGSVLAYTAPAPVVVTPPPVNTGIVYGYRNGVLSWGGDFTQGNTSVNYRDTVGDPGSLDIAFTSTAAYGLYLPYFGQPSANFLIPNPGYKALTFALKPTKAGARFTVMFVRSNDAPTNCVAILSPAPTVGQFTTYTLALSDLCVATDAQLYKFVLQDATGATSNKWYLKDLGFVF